MNTLRTFPKLLCLFVAMLFVMSLFAGCKGDVNDTDTTPQTEADTTNDLYDADGYLKDTLDPNLNYGNETFRILGWNSGYASDFYIESSTGDTVADSVYERNLAVEDRLNVDMECVFIDGNNSTMSAWVSTAMNSILVGDNGDSYDLFGCYSMCAGTLYAQSGIQSLSNLNHLNFEMPWWSDSLIEMSKIDNSLYFVTGDLSNAFVYNLYFLILNKDIVDSLDLDDPRDFVLDGTWTMDKFFGMTKDVYIDNDGEEGVSAGDRYGYVSYGAVHFDCFLAASGIRMTEQNGDGNFALTAEFTGDKTFNLINKVNTWLWTAEDNLFNTTEGYGIIKSGNALFGAVAGSTIYGFRDENWEYAVLPYPKLTEEQDSYYTNLGFAYSNFCVPLNAANPDMSAAVLECMASESYRFSAPVLFETCLKSRWSNDPLDAKMYDIIKSSVYVDVARVFNSSFEWAQSPVALFRGRLQTNKNEWMSVISGQTDYINGILEYVNGSDS